SSETLQGVMAFSSFYSSSALQSFVEKYNFSMGNVTDLGSNCLATGCNQAESNLDMQYITATAPNVSTIFIASPSNYWILEAMEELIMKMNKVPQVLSISYGTPEFLQCGTHDYCRTLGYSTSLYLSRSQIYFQALGIQGTSIIVASGDDGAMGFSPQTGNNPADNSTYCYNGGCSHSSSQCQQVRLASGSQSVIFPTFYLSSSSAAITNAVNAWALNNTKCNVTIENGYLYSSCPCQQLKYGVYSGVNVSLYERYSQRFGQAFTPSWPASDPYVTSVGATIFREGSGEEVASIKNGALVTSGGGFSQTFSTPAYQQRAVDNWMARAKMEGTLPPNGTFSSTMRGFPDISFAGHAFVVYQQNADGSSVETYVDGTSASAPAFSGFISALNDKLMLRGDRPMGFLNPLLYLVAQTRPDIYNDITVGDNKCTTSECYVHGYEATEGWDPASGLGSVNIGKLFEYVLQVTANETISQLVNSQTPMSTEMGTNGADAPMPTDPLATMNQQQNNESGRSNLVSAAWLDAPKWGVMVVALILACTM
ncbi:peptidase S8 and S53 domain-containing protein, partial [Planoprotostelium fungivorum]